MSSKSYISAFVSLFCLTSFKIAILAWTLVSNVFVYNIDPTTRAITLIYKLETSIQVAVGSSFNPRKVLLRGDILNRNQIFTLQSIVS